MTPYGIVDLPWWGYLAIALALTHITIAAVTIFLHRHQTHRALDLHPAIGHFFRFWLWLTTGMVTKEWVAIHRKHHARVETAADPHSPQIHGIGRVLGAGVLLYTRESRNHETIEKFGRGTPDDGAQDPLLRRRLMRAPKTHRVPKKLDSICNVPIDGNSLMTDTSRQLHAWYGF